MPYCHLVSINDTLSYEFEDCLPFHVGTHVVDFSVLKVTGPRSIQNVLTVSVPEGTVH